MEPTEYRSLHVEWYQLRSGIEDHSDEIDYWAERIDELAHRRSPDKDSQVITVRCRKPVGVGR